MNNETKLAISGAICGAAEALTVQPFDMVKTRHQLNTGTNESIMDTLRALYREGGVLRFYRGMAAEVLGMMPKSSGMYATYEMVRIYLLDKEGFGDTSKSAYIAGLASGVPEALIVQPFQIVKVRVQAKEHLGKYNGSFDCAMKLLRQEGVKAFTIGLGPTLYRNCVWNTVYFGFMHWLKAQLPAVEPKSFKETVQTFVAGFAGAVFATCFNAPFDVVKSRFQSQLLLPGQVTKYRGTWQSLGVIYREEGLLSCYKGFRPKALRMGLGGAVAMVTFELVNNMLGVVKA